MFLSRCATGCVRTFGIQSSDPLEKVFAGARITVLSPFRCSSKSHSPQNIKKDRAEETSTRKHPGSDLKDHDRVNSTGNLGENMTKNVKPEQLNPDDGAMEFKEKMSPGSTDLKKTLRQANIHPKSDVPQEVADRLEDETVDFIKKQSGMSGGASS